MSHKPSPLLMVNGNSNLRAELTVVSVLIGFILMFIILVAYHDTSPTEFIIADFSVTEFNFTSDSTLYYNFKLNITVRNPSSFERSMRKISAISSYKGNKFGVVDLTPFYISERKTILLKPVVFYGNSLIKLNAQQHSEYDNETRLRIFNLDLKLDQDADVFCLGLRVPLISNGKLESTFNVTKCTREYQGWG